MWMVAPMRVSGGLVLEGPGRSRWVQDEKSGKGVECWADGARWVIQRLRCMRDEVRGPVPTWFQAWGRHLQVSHRGSLRGPVQAAGTVAFASPRFKI